MDNKTPVLTMCDGADKCKIVTYKYNFFNSVSSINSQGNKNTQPHFAEHDEQNVCILFLTVLEVLAALISG